MTLRIAVGGFLHESHSFAPNRAAWQDFIHSGGLPGLVRGPSLRPALRGTATALAGAITEAETHGVTLAGLDQDATDCAAGGLMDVLAGLEPQFVLALIPRPRRWPKPCATEAAR